MPGTFQIHKLTFPEDSVFQGEVLVIGKFVKGYNVNENSVIYVVLLFVGFNICGS